MKYELAKELKDAGFPQHSCTDITCSKNALTIPTLSELIEACGDGRFKLSRTKMWHAVIQKGDMPSHDWKHGFTPEEAVARLWLALNTKS